MRALVCSLGLFIPFVLAAPVAHGAKAVTCEQVQSGTISVDGLRSDWADRTPLELAGSHVLSGRGMWQGKPDLEGTFKCAHDEKGTYLLLEVNDDQVVRTRRPGTQEDRVELVFDAGRGKVRTLRIHPPNATVPRASVRWVGRSPLPRGIKSSVIRLRNGYVIEMMLTDGSVPGYRLGSPTVKMSVRIIDHDGGPSRKADTVLGFGGDTATTLGLVEYDTAKRLLAGFLKEKGLTRGNILYYAVGNYITGKAQEQLVIAGNWIALIGEDVMKGGAYYAAPAPFAKVQSDLLRFRSVDLDGNGNLDIVYVARQQGTQGLVRDVFVALRYLDTGRLDLYFAHEIVKRQGGRVLENRYRFIKRRKATDVEISVQKNSGWTKQNHFNSGGGRLESILIPWGKKKKRYQFGSDGVTEK